MAGRLLRPPPSARSLQIGVLRLILSRSYADDGRVRNYRAHGLRKAALRALAHAGATGVELMAISGHSSLDQVQEYINEVDQEQAAEAAMTKLALKP
jgi:integrase